MKERLKKLCINVCRLLAAGLFYAFLCTKAGHPIIPCIFHLVTGLYCPGCGVSRLCLALLNLDFHAAYHANAAVFIMLPVGFIMSVQAAAEYVRTGRYIFTKRKTNLITFLIVVLIVFCVARNLNYIFSPSGPPY